MTQLRQNENHFPCQFNHNINCYHCQQKKQERTH